MRSFTLITALLLCSLSSVSGSESQTVKVQSGDEVTLTCNNIASSPTFTEWFRLINRTKPSCISAMYKSQSKASYCVGFQKEKFEMSSNNTTVFLKIKQVNISDSGLYFCGFYMDAHIVIVNVTHLIVQGDGESEGEVDFKAEKEFTVTATLMSLILGGLTVSLTIVVVVLAVKVRKLQRAVNEEPQPERNKNLGSDELNYAALSFQAKPKRSRRPAPGREMEPHVVYAATR